jgi:hypothetical protein
LAMASISVRLAPLVSSACWAAETRTACPSLRIRRSWRNDWLWAERS